MDINSFSVIMAIILFTVVSAICSWFLFRTKSQHLWIVGFSLALCILRCLIPVEFAGTHNVNVWTIYPEFFAFLKRELFLGIKVRGFLCIIWLAVGSLFLLRLILELTRQIRFDLSVLSQEMDERMMRIANKAANAVHCSADVSVYVTNSVLSPTMIGIFHPVVLIPESAAEMSDLEIEYILRHEIAHFKGGDTWIKLAIQILVCVLWWNPGAYLLRRSINQLLELRSDSRACQSLDPNERTDYTAVLLKVVENALATQKKLISSGFVGNFDSRYAKQRIKILLDKTVPKRSPLATALIAGVCIALYLGSYTFIVQPAFTPQEVESSDLIASSPENSYLVRIEDDKYEVWVDGKLLITITYETAKDKPFDQFPIYEKEQ